MEKKAANGDDRRGSANSEAGKGRARATRGLKARLFFWGQGRRQSSARRLTRGRENARTRSSDIERWHRREALESHPRRRALRRVFSRRLAGPHEADLRLRGSAPPD